jgi:RNA polymerase sigma factor (sigma-70 family)
MVLGICRRVLGDAHEAEDAFQATFLVLARKAASVVRREKVASWLYGVACRTAREARLRASRRRAREERVSKPARVLPDETDSLAELRAILDEELARLPVRYRGAVVLCELEGLSRQQAARRLGIPEGTLSSRLARAKAELRARLIRRGLAVPVVALLGMVVREASGSPLPGATLESTVAAAMRIAAGYSVAGAVSASVASLTEGVLKIMLLARLKVFALCMGAVAAFCSGAVVVAQAQPQNSDRPPVDSDRTAAMERKLDRIITALDRLTGTAANESAPLGTAGDPARLLEEAVRSDAADNIRVARAQAAANFARSLIQDKSVSPSGSRLPLRDRQKLPLSDRMDAMERALDAVQQRIQQVEKRLDALDKRVGLARDPGAVGLNYLRGVLAEDVDALQNTPQERYRDAASAILQRQPSATRSLDSAPHLPDRPEQTQGSSNKNAAQRDQPHQSGQRLEGQTGNEAIINRNSQPEPESLEPSSNKSAGSPAASRNPH